MGKQEHSSFLKNQFKILFRAPQQVQKFFMKVDRQSQR